MKTKEAIQTLIKEKFSELSHKELELIRKTLNLVKHKHKRKS